MSTSEALALALPPFIGAVIGLFTNWLAIKMLFRPLAEKRIAGLKVPFTPGILPRERERISKALGDTVSTDLITDETVAERLGTPQFKAALRDSAQSALGKALSATPGGIAEGLGGDIAAPLRGMAMRALRTVMASEAFASSLEAGFDALLEKANALPIHDALSAEGSRSLLGRLCDERTKEALSRLLSGAIVASLAESAAGGATIASIVDEESVLGVARRLAVAAYPTVCSALSDTLADKAVSSTMEKAGARIIARALDRFNAVQRFFIGLGQYDKAILDNMPATVADFRQSIEEMLALESTRDAVVDHSCGALASVMERPLSGFAMFASATATESARADLARLILDVLEPVSPESILSLADKAAGDTSVGDILGGIPAVRNGLGKALARWLSGLMAESPGREGGIRAAASSFTLAFAGKYKEASADVPLAALVGLDGFEDDEGVAALCDYAAQGLSRAAVDESSRLVKSIDVKALVVDKIDSLDMIDVEKMILKVVDRELSAITWFGAILGGAIGICQSVLLLLS